ncbi:DUF2103 domain-containing protein [Halovivax limisalsi]|uniref:DUF2103 domain-containing protein n=1 Tax=Halovivax limisalsi TaxID=1453760 RepID=UPI001FFC430F|nr:DUF2103 domain-containing protein [Halovivax limisalsi]
MECRHCASPLEKPGDYCLVCRTRNADTVVLDAARDRATITMLAEADRAGETTVTTTPESEGDRAVVELRNFAGRVADEIRRKRPTEIYATGERPVIRAVRSKLRYPFYRVDDPDPVAYVRDRRGEDALDVVETPPAEKIGGSHSTLIGGRSGVRAIQTVAEHPHVKKVIPGPIDAGGTGSQSGLRAKVARSGDGGNLRLLLRDGSSVQENRVVTTAWDRDTGERVREALNEALVDADMREA